MFFPQWLDTCKLEVDLTRTRRDHLEKTESYYDLRVCVLSFTCLLLF